MIRSLVHVISSRDVFGPEKTTINECRTLIRGGSKCAVVNIVPPHRGEPMHKKVQAAGIPYHRVGGSHPIDLGLSSHIRRIVVDLEADIVHSHGFKSDVYCYLALRHLRVPLVTTVHGWTSESFKVRLYERLQSLFWRRYDRVFAVSNAYLETAAQRGVPLSKLTLLYNGIVVPELPQTTEGGVRDRQRAQWGFDDGHIVVASVGRLSAEKNHGLLLDAAALLKGRESRCRFVMVGDGPMRATIEQRIRSLGIENDVCMTGHVDDMTAVYAGVDVLAIHSLREGLPNVLLEAMLARIPVVSVPVGGVPEVIDGGRGGVLTIGWHAEEFADALQRLADDEGLRSRLGAQGRELVSSSFSFQRRMDLITAEYERLLV